MEEWVLNKLHTKSPQDWKYIMYIKHKTDVDTIRIFLRHHEFCEQPLKNSVHVAGESRHYVTILPYHPITKFHVNTENVLGVFEYEDSEKRVELTAIDTHTSVNDIESISKSTIEYGSIFTRADLNLTITLVEKVHEEEYGKSCNANKTTKLLLSATWPGTSTNIAVQKILSSIEKIKHLFDF